MCTKKFYLKLLMGLLLMTFLSPPAAQAEELTIAKNGSSSSDYTYIPVYGQYMDTDGTLSQTIYSSSSLSDLKGKNITSIKYYADRTLSQFSTVELQISLLETDNEEFSTATALTGFPAALGTCIISGTETEIVFNLNTPFTYSGLKNLAVEVKVVGSKSNKYGTIYWYGEDTNKDVAYYYYKGWTEQSGVESYLPKTTFTYEAAGPKPEISATSASLNFNTVAGTAVDNTVTVTGANLTGDITPTISGDNASYFTVSPESLGTNGGELTVTYNPTDAGNHTATLTLSSAGAQDVTIALTGTATAPTVPTIAVNPATVTINTEPNTTGTATFTVTGTNLTGDITVAASDSWFTVSPTTIAAADAANGVTVTVSYQAPGTEETKTGTITITSNGATEKIVNLTAKSEEVIAEGEVTPTALNFGEVLVGQSATAQQIKVSNTGSETFTPSFSIDNSVFTIDEPTAIAGGTSIYYNVNYTPTAAGTDNGTLTVTFGGNTFTVTLMGKGTELADYDVTVNQPSGVHNFGDVFKDGVATWDITITNNGKNAVTPTFTGLEGAFSAENVPASIASGESATVTIKFAPTEIKAYGPTSIVLTFDGTDIQYDYTLRGNGIENTGTLPPSTFDNYSYTWTDKNGDEHTSLVSEIATEPEQMIALLREVYTNKNLPGPKYRGYDANGNAETAYPVPYPAIGTMTRFGTFGVADNYTFNDAYGWGFTHDEANYPSELLLHNSGSHNYYKGLNGNEYKPNEEGLTLLLVEMKDGANSTTVSRTISSSNTLVNIFDKMFKSVRVITNSKKVTKNGVEGTLFKIDCDKMNRFFFLGKGRLRLQGENDADGGLLGRSNYYIDKDNQTTSTGSITNVANDGAPFFEMFEQFSPVSLIEGTESNDVYQELINMQSYPVEHDCVYIPWAPAQTTGGEAGHEFNMYGKSSISDDCQDVRDLMFFVPDQRMKAWASRDRGANDKFVNYYEEGGYAPTMGMYVIKQNPITGEQKTYEGNDDNYELHLTWDSNLTDFVPSDKGVYYIYQVNENGSYTKVGETNAQTKELYVNVAMQDHGQQVTYVIQGQDNTGFLSLQFSNEESFIIPGTDVNEVFQLVPNADIYSRFDPAQETNFYANGMQIKTYPGVATKVYAGQTLNYYRKAEGETEWTKVATAAVNSDATQATVATVEGTQRQQSEYIYGYKANASTMTIAADGHGYNVFGVIYDNFKASVEGNKHPNYYNYKVEIDGQDAHSNEITVRVFKTAMSTIDGEFDKNTVDGDVTHTVGLEKTAFDIDVQHSSKTEVLRYGAYRWTQSENPAILSGTADAEEDISPNGQASNQGEYYTVYMNGDSFIGEDVYVAQGETAQASFEDNVPDNNPDAYVYAPVVETFTGRADYNTYGAPMQTTATGKTELTVGELSASTYKFTPEGKTGDYVYYNIPLTANVTIPENYDIYKMRAWRLVDEEWLGEIDPAYADRVNPDYLYETLDDASKGQPIPVGIDVITRPGTNDQNVLTGTFGAKKLAEGESFTAKFIVRTYFTRTAETSTFNAAQSVDGKYYITETVIDVPVTNQVVTGVINVNAQKAVAGVMYYNLAGMQSEEPFSGVNIVVTRYTDGSISTAKVLK